QGHRPDPLAAAAAVSLDEQSRHPRSPVGDVPRVVGAHPRAVAMSAREEMLASIRSARAGAELVEPARGYRTSGEQEPGSAALLDLLEDRLLDYKAAVRRADPTGLRAAVAEALELALAASGAK